MTTGPTFTDAVTDAKMTIRTSGYIDAGPCIDLVDDVGRDFTLKPADAILLAEALLTGARTCARNIGFKGRCSGCNTELPTSKSRAAGDGAGGYFCAGCVTAASNTF